MKYPDDTFLARWMAGTLSAEEKAEFEKSEDFKKLSLFMDTLGQAQAHPFDHASVLAQIKEKQKGGSASATAKVRFVRPIWYVLAAAAVAVLLFFFWPSPNASLSVQEYATTVGEQMELNLADGSFLQLNAASKARVELTEDFSSRKVFLEGEAYFEVRKKGAFSVSTALGLVEVLGTKFSVRERERGLEVQCFEGVVKLSLAAKSSIDTLRAGQGLRMDKNGQVSPLTIEREESGPSWTKGVSQLTNLPLSQIIKEYERQFGLEIQLDPSLDLERVLTVSFPHAELKSALEIGLGAFEIEVLEVNGQILLKPN